MVSLFWFVHFVVVLFTNIVCQVFGISCYDAYECMGTTISESSDSIACYGYFSCANTKITMSTSGSFKRIHCSGSNACNGASYIIQNATDSSYTKRIECRGLYSCANVNYIYNTDGYTACNGELSCYNSHLVNTYQITCHGSKSCQNAVIEGNNVRVTGYLAALNAVFDTSNTSIFSGISEIYYVFQSFYAAYNSTIICGNNQICNIECSDNACDYLTLINNKSENSSFKVTCDGAWKSEICPNNSIEWYLEDSNNNLINNFDFDMSDIFPNLFNVSFSTVENSLNTCNDINKNISNSINCGSYQECSNETIVTNNGSVCCTSVNGCRLTNSINASNDINSDYLPSVRCDGYQSCQLVSDGIFSKNGDIYITGSDAMNEADSNVNIVTSFENNNNMYDNYCNGEQSCHRQNVFNANNIYCMAYSACDDSILMKNTNNNIYFYGGLLERLRTEYGFIENVGNNVICAAQYACIIMNIKNVYNSIYGIGYHVLYNNSIENVKNNIIAIGESALAFSNVKNVTNIFCKEKASCQNTMINGFSQLIANGTDALSDSIIITGGLNNGVIKNNIVRLIIIDENMNSFNVYCNETDICQIYCESYYSCINMNLYCFGECFIDCDYDNNGKNSENCVDLVFGNYSIWIRNDTSVMPSVQPSSYPTMVNTTMIDNNNDDSSSNDDSSIDITVSETIIIVIIVCVTFLLCICMMFTFVAYNSKLKAKLDIETANQMVKVHNNNNNNGNNNNSMGYHIQHSAYNSNASQLQLVSPQVLGLEGTTKGNNDNNNNNNNNNENGNESENEEESGTMTMEGNQTNGETGHAIGDIATRDPHTAIGGAIGNVNQELIVESNNNDINGDGNEDGNEDGNGDNEVDDDEDDKKDEELYDATNHNDNDNDNTDNGFKD